MPPKTEKDIFNQEYISGSEEIDTEFAKKFDQKYSPNNNDNEDKEG